MSKKEIRKLMKEEGLSWEDAEFCLQEAAKEADKPKRTNSSGTLWWGP